MAIPESEMTGSSSPKIYSETSGTEIHESAATIKTMSTERSPIDIGPNLFHSFLISSAPPGMFFTSGLNITLARINQAPIIRTIERGRSEEHTSELQSRGHLVCSLLLEKT